MTLSTASAAVLLASAVLVLSPAAASASCMGGTPLPSPHRFEGTVVAVDGSGRVAKVRTLGGDTVEVHGSPEEGSVITSVDRTYLVGHRYEFHPTNERPPYDDNICTATRDLGPMTGGAPGGTESADANGATVPVKSGGSGVPTGWAVGGLAAAVVAGAALVALRPRRLLPAGVGRR